MSRPHQSRVGSEAGVSLVEVLVALAILGIAVTSIVAGLTTASIASGRHRQEVNADTVVRSYAEAIKEQVHLGGYVTCATTATDYTIPAATWTPTPGYTVSFDHIQFWHALPAPGGFTNPPCATDEGAQLLSLSATSSDGHDTETLQVIVRKQP